MRVHQICTYSSGGAGIAARRLTQGLLAQSCGARLFSVDAAGARGVFDQAIPIRFGGSLVEKLWRRFRHWQIEGLRSRTPQPVFQKTFFSDLSCYGMALLRACQGADVLNFHWVCDLLDYPYVLARLPKTIPLVWTLHDMNPFTGGCNYSFDCAAFQAICGHCPQLGSACFKDLSNEIWKRKARSLQGLKPPLTIVTPSAWLAGEARKSSLFGTYPIHIIPNGLDTAVFRPCGAADERRRLKLKVDAPLLLFVGGGLRKGFESLLKAWPMVRGKWPSAQLLVIGGQTLGMDLPKDVRVLNPASNEEEIARVYACADLLVVPSAAENLPNVIIEALACGVPAVGFKVGGVPELIRDGQTGYLAKESTAPELAAAIDRLLTDVFQDREKWRKQCRDVAEREFSLEIQARRYKNLYESLLAGNKSDQ